MGWAVFPLRTGDKRRVMVNVDNVIEVREDVPADGHGQATIGMTNGRWWFLAEDANTIWSRLIAAGLKTSAPVYPPGATPMLLDVTPQQLPYSP